MAWRTTSRVSTLSSSMWPDTHRRQGRIDGAVVSVHLLDMASGTDLSGPLFTWSGLTNYSFDDFKGYSPPQTTTVSGLSVPTRTPLDGTQDRQPRPQPSGSAWVAQT